MSAELVKLQSSGIMMEIAPGKPIPALEIPRTAVPRYGMVRLSRQPDGSYIPVLLTWGQTVRLTGRLAHEMGFDADYNTLMRLYMAGFIKGHRMAPGVTLLDLQSIYDHLERTRDPEYWTEERRAQYRKAI